MEKPETSRSAAQRAQTAAALASDRGKREALLEIALEKGAEADRAEDGPDADELVGKNGGCDRD